jgi:hypothetical protein
METLDLIALGVGGIILAIIIIASVIELLRVNEPAGPVLNEWLLIDEAPKPRRAPPFLRYKPSMVAMVVR